MKRKSDKFKVIAISLAVLSTLLIIASFILPPLGVVDPSVLGAVGEIFGFTSLFMAWDSIEKGLGAKWTHGNTTIEIEKDEDEE